MRKSHPKVSRKGGNLERSKNGFSRSPFIANDFKEEDTWRMFRIMSEFVEGFEALRNIRPAVTVFGSARTVKNAKDYQLARKIAYLLFQKRLYRHHGGRPRHHGGG